MSYPYGFDPTTRCTERLPDAVWLEYTFSEHRAERDAIYGRTPDEYERSLGIPAEPKDREYIPRDKLFQVYEAIRFVNYCGHVFNVDLTISWQEAGLRDPIDIDRAFQMLSDRLRKYARHRKQPVYYYAVFENSRYTGYHSHMSLHIPRYLHSDFSKWLRATLKQGFLGQSIGEEHYHRRLNKDLNIVGQWIRFQYCMKGVNPKLSAQELRCCNGKTTVHEMIDLKFASQPAGIVKIDQVRISRSMGAKAQREAGYAVRESLCDLTGPALWDDAEYRRGFDDRRCAEMSRIRCEVIL